MQHLFLGLVIKLFILKMLFFPFFSLMSLPEKPPTINFELYRSRLPNQAMVTEFEKQVF